jgi:hypothetical protein
MGLGLNYWENNKMKIAEPVQNDREVSLAMTTVLIARGHYVWRQQKKIAVIARRNDAAIFLISSSPSAGYR